MNKSPTEAEIVSAMTSVGGWTKKQLAEWGVPWPPPKGWKRKLAAGGFEPSHAQANLHTIQSLIVQRIEAEPTSTPLWHHLCDAADAISRAIEAETRAKALSDLAAMDAEQIDLESAEREDV